MPETVNIAKNVHFNDRSNMMMLPISESNHLTRPERLNDGRFWQDVFGLYSHMSITDKGAFIINQLRGSNLVWQPEQGCVWSPMGEMQFGKTKLTPEAIELQQELCDDELFNSCFKTYHEYINGNRSLKAEAERLMNLLFEEITYNAIEGLYITSTVGGYYDMSKVKFAEGVTAKTQKNFRIAAVVGKGWLTRLKELAAAGRPNLNIKAFTAEDFDEYGTYTGDLVKLFDKLRAAGTKKMRRLINRGEFRGRGGQILQPLMVVSDNIYSAVVGTYEKVSEQAATNMMRITRREISYNGLTKQVYYIGNVPIIPLDEINGFSEYLKTEIAFAGIILSGNLQIGQSWGALQIPGNNTGEEIGLMVQGLGAGDIRELGKKAVRAFSMQATAIGDTDYMVCSIQDIEEKA